MKTRIGFATVLLFAGCLPQETLQDTNFDLWCGNSLCNWETEEGSIRRVPTWDAQDFGVELVKTPSLISQMADLSIFSDEPCMDFTIIGKVEASAQVRLELDFIHGGDVDFTQIVPSLDWQRTELLVKLPTQSIDGIKVGLHKVGRGKAIFAHLAATYTQACQGAPIHLTNLPAGGDCTSSDDCTSHLCAPAGPGLLTPTCSECLSDADCANGDLCAPSSPGPRFLTCRPPHSTSNGDPCRSSAECAVGFCSIALSGVCTVCEKDADCSNGKVCGFVTSGPGRFFERACNDPPASAAP
jgi:hypothetical protein